MTKTSTIAITSKWIIVTVNNEMIHLVHKFAKTLQCY